ncbi:MULTISPECIES: hypothetical protein [unclassified Pseudomonas]|uniref:hypothetical protein n=1 Tax=unclassified Pseudomonas TaxID=196821 RepID=UPI000BA34FC6|nr:MULTISPECIES: hypothetical protein [unclassified Pseudomonas]MCU1723395.1 hypothetical protein [Pseudomonas sp. 5P_5.1_Bac1]MCU1731029.1 hypothetical protein [Pseudomonas sp. 20P_3.2_Bac4]MCU1742752.1 hypothetical protein [Pseudomonas sp. 20P_3.2_Bac5]
MKTIVVLSLAATVLSGCGNIAAVKSFNTQFASPASGETARLRVMSDGMVRGVPGLACVDWYSPGAGVIIVPNETFAQRNNEKLGMPAGKPVPAGWATSEVRVAAGKPLTLTFLDGGRAVSYDQKSTCLGMFTFTPQAGADYELELRGYRGCGVDFTRIDGATPEPVKATKAEYCSAIANF